MKLAIGIVVVLLLLGGSFYFLNEGHVNQKMAQMKGFTRVCVDDVSYLQFPSGATVQYNADGSIKRCD